MDTSGEIGPLSGAGDEAEIGSIHETILLERAVFPIDSLTPPADKLLVRRKVVSGWSATDPPSAELGNTIRRQPHGEIVRESD
jgi:hypothetical protein